jgi:hypothetical protein
VPGHRIRERREARVNATNLANRTLPDVGIMKVEQRPGMERPDPRHEARRAPADSDDHADRNDHVPMVPITF